MTTVSNERIAEIIERLQQDGLNSLTTDIVLVLQSALSPSAPGVEELPRGVAAAIKEAANLRASAAMGKRLLPIQEHVIDLDDYAHTLASRLAAPAGEFQGRVQPWMLACFGAEIASDKNERSHRFLEEALELVQAAGCTRDEALQLVDYVYSRPIGYLPQEVGGVMITLAALCLAWGENMHTEGETELARIWTKVDVIRAKQAAKPKHSPLPAPPSVAKGEKS